MSKGNCLGDNYMYYELSPMVNIRKDLVIAVSFQLCNIT